MSIAPPIGHGDARADGDVDRARRIRGAVFDNLAATEATLVALSVVTALTFARLFADWGFVPRLLVATVASHGVAIAGRRLIRSNVGSMLFSVAAMAVVLGILFFPGKTFLGLPTATTWDAAVEAIRLGWRDFQSLRAPVPATAGFMLPAAMALWISAFLADSFAFRVRASVEAVVPMATVFVFTSALAADQYRFPSAAAFLLAAIIVVAAHRAWMQADDTSTWLASDHRSVLPSLLRVGAVLGAVAVIGGVVVGPALPGAGDAELLDLRHGGSGPSTRVTVSPLVDIRSRLAQRTDTIAFTVTSSQPAYWRLTALDTFDGSIWRSEASYSRVSGKLPQSPTGTTEVQQKFSIAALESIWLPAAYQPSEISGVSASYDAATASLITRSGVADDATYTVTSVLPSYAAATLQNASATIEPDIQAADLQMPANFPSRLVRLARTITTNATTRYEKALALQNYFRQNFTYSLDVQSGHGTDAITAFLNARKGYCEQFAGTFAAFARSLGIPARVAVGFTPGTQDGTTYTVRDRHAHAWPEVYFSGLGWVAFEPTPGRGAPGAESYTNVPPAQDDATVNGTQPDPATTTVPTDAAANTDPGAAPDPNVTGADDPTSSIDITGGGTPSEAVRWYRHLLTVALVLGVALVAWLAVVLLSRRQRRRRRRRSATTNAQRVLVAWTEATEALHASGVDRRRSDTHHEFAERAAAATGLDRGTLVSFASWADAALFAGDDLEERAVVESRQARALVYRTQVEEASIGRRLRFVLDPRI
ncbi:MAG: DUF3488 and DUF4129 domain-containing transglutaminase family protein [Acidimicrobiia bacterium]